MEFNKFPEIVLFKPLEALRRVARAALMLHDAPLCHSNHYNRDHFEHPLDAPVEMVTSWPGQESSYGTSQNPN